MKRIIALTALVGCGSPTHLQYDHGRASSQAFAAQGNLARPEAVDAAIPMQGPEALKIRESVHAKATDENSGKPEVVKDIGVN
jgi:hypothetical protein